MDRSVVEADPAWPAGVHRPAAALRGVCAERLLPVVDHAPEDSPEEDAVVRGVRWRPVGGPRSGSQTPRATIPPASAGPRTLRTKTAAPIPVAGPSHLPAGPPPPTHRLDQTRSENR